MFIKIFSLPLILSSVTGIILSTTAFSVELTLGIKTTFEQVIPYRDMSLPTVLKFEKIEVIKQSIGGTSYKSFRIHVSGSFSAATTNIKYDLENLGDGIVAIRIYGEQNDEETLTPFNGFLDLGPMVTAKEKIKFVLVKANGSKFQVKFIESNWF